jgi:hypothetical protein
MTSGKWRVPGGSARKGRHGAVRKDGPGACSRHLWMERIDGNVSGRPLIGGAPQPPPGEPTNRDARLMLPDGSAATR